MSLYMPFDHELYARVIKTTQAIAKEKGLLWEEEQAEIAYEIITSDKLMEELLNG